MRTVTWSLALWLVLSSCAHAQSDWEAVKKLAPGTTLRVRGLTGPRQVRGQFQSADELQLTMMANEKPVVLDRQIIQQIEMTTGKRHVKKSALLGLGIGAAVGALLGWVAGGEISDKERRAAVLIWAGVGTLIGTIKGVANPEYVLVYRSVPL